MLYKPHGFHFNLAVKNHSLCNSISYNSSVGLIECSELRLLLDNSYIILSNVG